jgi:hypothetical protein
MSGGAAESALVSQRCQLAAERLGGVADRTLLEHADGIISTFDIISPLIHEEQSEIIAMLREAREELIDFYVEAVASREKIALILLRGVMEGIFTSLYYRHQTMSLNLWAKNTGFHLTHHFFEEKHEFYRYFKDLFEDERFTLQYPSVKFKAINSEANAVYEILSANIHKKFIRNQAESKLTEVCERMFRIALTYLERECDLPQLPFPRPISYAEQKAVRPKGFL